LLPKVILHIGCSLDGRIDWLKPDNFLYYRIIQDWQVDAMISGSNTMLAAEMSSEPNIQKLDDQYLVVVDSQGKIDNWADIKRQAYWNDTPIALCSERTPQEYLVMLAENGVHALIHGAEKVDLRAALQELQARFAINVLRVDSGGGLAGALLSQGLVDEVSVIISPQLTGGTSPKTIFVSPDLTSEEGVIDLRLMRYEVLDVNYVHLYYQVIK
jgi:2,5-diamino-6-(ribosylamino)-4(3H)-pyrimidinone 5'-phosphate reductase